MNGNKIADNMKRFALIMLLCLSTITPALGQSIQKPEAPEIPEIPQGAQILNLTDVIPNEHRYIYEHGTPNVLSFKNLRLEINSTKNLEFETTVNQEIAMQYLALDLDPSKSLNLTILIDVNPPAEASKPKDDVEIYLTIEPNSTDPVDSTLKLFINETAIEDKIGRDIRPHDLNWAFWNGSAWETVRSWLDEEGYLAAKTDHFSTWTIVEAGRPIPVPEIPGVPQGADAHNYSDIVPEGFTWRVREHEPNVLVFRNVTMMLNSTKSLDLNITTGQQVNNHVFRLDLVPSESLSLDIDIDVIPPSGVMRMEKDIGLYVEIEPNATVTLDAKLSLFIDETVIEAQVGRDIDVSQLTWAYWNEGAWVPVESVIDENGYLNANTTHFSTWTVMEETEAPEPTPEPSPEPRQTQWQLYAGLVALAFIAAMAIIFLTRRR